jgi:hypothetical protein
MASTEDEDEEDEEDELDPARIDYVDRVPPAPYVLKRRCIECGAFLSRYNTEKYCFTQDPSPGKGFTW